MNATYFTKGIAAKMFAAIALFSLIASMLPVQAFAGVGDITISGVSGSGTGPYAALGVWSSQQGQPCRNNSGFRYQINVFEDLNNNNAFDTGVDTILQNINPAACDGGVFTGAGNQPLDANSVNWPADGQAASPSTFNLAQGTHTICSVLLHVNNNGNDIVATDCLPNDVVVDVMGCTDPLANNYDATATVDDGSCTYDPDPILGCTDPTAFNYNPNATQDDGSCVPKVFGCMDPDANNYNANANVSDGSCAYDIRGCTNPAATNYNPAANVDDGSCIVPVTGCTNPDATNYNPDATEDDGSCIIPIPGCTDPLANNHDVDATVNDGSCTYDVLGCIDPLANNFNELANKDDGSCIYDPDPIPGCTDATASNYNPDATQDDGSCTYNPDDILGCTDQTALNYNSAATVDDKSCRYDDNNGGDNLSCTINANDTSIRRGRDVTITWNSANAVAAKLNGETVNLDASQLFENLREDTTYTLTVMGENESTETCSVFVNTTSGGGGGGSRDNDEPDGEVLGEATSTPEVLGEQVDAVPLGAANTGAGATSPFTLNYFAVTPVAFFRRTKVHG
jgi:hypothetical protein